ncbi:putative sodium dependent transporter [Cyanobium sp. PCC 7001]|uniref:bile acid:sodium symporter family protein n=1 Tax=Cyanobium sp. PCC 7001 TaxID=180281 RepID=UPI0001805D3D|nr:bile acid:sodium symporter [Cyanobium sp. PCC 7001]EDY39208.1 putative sodium dependent transporter [Cyanobium sp. PCC 7001]
MLAAITLFAIMLGLGLGLRLEALGRIRERPGLFLRVVPASCLVVPVVALLLLQLPIGQSLGEAARIGIALMAISPSAPLTLRKAGAKGGDRELAALLQVVAALTAILSVPLMADLYRAAYHTSAWDIGSTEVALQVGRTQVLPLLLGMGVRHRLPDLADRLESPLNKVANGLFLLLVVVVLVAAGPTLLPFLGRNADGVLLMLALVAFSLGLGYLLASRGRDERITVALVTSMRNPGLALMFASTYGQGVVGLKVAVLAYLLVTVLLSIPFLKTLNRIEAGQAEPGG